MLQDADMKKVSDPCVRDWLDQVKDVSYKMNDLVDGWTLKLGNEKLRNKKERLVSQFLATAFVLPNGMR